MKNISAQITGSPFGLFVMLAGAALLEVTGDACFQSALYRSEGTQRAAWFTAGAVVLAAYGLLVNLPQWDFGKILGVYVVLFFLVAQVVAKVRFHQSPTLPVVVGGLFIVTGGAIITFWKHS
jgi:small multidrug resistance family-3 protein